jgi:hypothetical protein
MASAVQQVLQQAHTFRASYAALVGEEDPEVRVFSPRMLLIIGNLGNEEEIAKKRNFELYRNSLRNIDIVTFDELVAKARLLLELFSDDPV